MKNIVSLINISSKENYFRLFSKGNLYSISKKEEFRHACRLYKKGNLESAKILINAHLGFVIKIAKGYLGYGIPITDLIQEGNIGLMKAVKKFNPYQGVRLITYAVYWIKSEINNYIINNFGIIKIATTKSQKKLFFNLRKIKKNLQWFTKKDIKNLANKLEVKISDVKEMEKRLNMNYQSLENSLNKKNEIIPKINYSILNKYNPSIHLEKTEDYKIKIKKLFNAIKILDKRSKYILRKRWFSEKKVTLNSLSKIFKISAERVRQIEKNSIRKLKILLNKKHIN